MKGVVSVFIAALTVQSFAVPSYAFVDIESRNEKVSKERLAKFHERYTATGKERRCIPYSQIRNTEVLNNDIIFFRTTGRKGYINKLSHACPQLLFEERFAYRSTGGSLCRGQIITVLDSFGMNLSSCSLGDFQEYKRKPKDTGPKDSAIEGTGENR